jgi:dTDP-4-amino-4,6-dideoxygalactose transaminase
MTTAVIPFNRPTFVANEWQYLQEAATGNHWSGDGAFTHRCHQLLETSLGVKKALLTTSCTHALEMAALLLDIGPGDEVIVPSFTFVSTVNAFVLRGARPVFADIRRDTLNMDDGLLDSLVTARTKAVVPVHYAGVGCELDAILDVANRHGLSVVEDNAHGLFGSYRNRPLGSFGVLATQSFHETKNFACGEGGALLINDSTLIERAEVLREKGTNRSRFFRGQVDKYSWVDVGSSYLPSDLLAAVLCAQLESRGSIQAARRDIWNRYDAALRPWADAHGVGTPVVPSHCSQAFHMYYLMLPSLARRQALIARLRARGIMSVFHYLPLHLSDMGLRFGGVAGQCPVTEDVSERLLRLPFFTALAPSQQEEVIVGVIEEYDRI